MSKFRAYGEFELPNLLFTDTRDEAFVAATERLVGEAIAGNPQNIIIEEVKEAEIGDFFDMSDLVSVMRERMAAKMGNDDVFTDENIAKLTAQDDGYLAECLNDVAHNAGVTVDGYIAISRARVENWWIRDPGDADV